MGIFNTEPDIHKLVETADVKGLIKALKYKKHVKQGKDLTYYGLTRQIAANELGKLGDTSAIEPLSIAASGEPYFPAYSAVLLALVKLGVRDKELTEKIISAYCSAEVLRYFEIREQMYEAMKLITGLDFGKEYDGWYKWYEKQNIE